MSNRLWPDEESGLIVADCFTVQADVISRPPRTPYFYVLRVLFIARAPDEAAAGVSSDNPPSACPSAVGYSRD